MGYNNLRFFIYTTVDLAVVIYIIGSHQPLESDMKYIIVLTLALFTGHTMAEDYNYVGSEHEMKLKDGTYEKTKQRIVIGRSIKIYEYQTFC